MGGILVAQVSQGKETLFKTFRSLSFGGVAKPCLKTPSAVPVVSGGQEGRQLSSPAVLVPSLDLSIREVECRCQVHAVLDTEVLLPLEAPLQLIELVVGESCPGFSRFLGSHRGTLSATCNLPVSFFLCS